MDRYNPQLIVDTINKAIVDAGGLAQLHAKGARNTNGGELAGSCPRCKALGNGGNNIDRFIVWPQRPVDGQGSHDDPCFYCRRCTRADDPTKAWTGDLIQFVRDVYHMSFADARMFLGLDPVTANATSVLLRPSLSLTGAPHDGWQKRGFDFVAEAEQRLWTPEGAPYLAYLTNKRGLTEETIRKAKLGCVTETHYVDASTWAMGADRMIIQRGIVFPEYHALEQDGVIDLSLWSVAIRRADSDLDLEEAETGRRPEKYHVVRGSTKGLYGYESAKPGLPLCLVEGQVDALTIMQEGKGEFAVAALQSAMGGRSLLWLSRINYAAFVMIMTDPDHAGRDAYEYWHNAIEPNRQMIWMPHEGDVNWMHTQGRSVYDFLALARNTYGTFFLRSTSTRNALIPAEPVNLPLEQTGRFSCGTEARSPIHAQKEEVPLGNPDTICAECGMFFYPEHMHAYPGQGDEVILLCKDCHEHCIAAVTPRCYKCGVALTDTEGLEAPYFCEDDFASARLLAEGKQRQWMGLATEEVGLMGGFSSYMKFIRDNDKSRLMEVSLQLHALNNGIVEPKEKAERIIEHHCARQGCQYDVLKHTMHLYYPQKFEDNKYNSAKDLEFKGIRHCLNGQWLHWCASCTDGYYALLIAEFLGFPVFHRAGAQVDAGIDAWIVKVTHGTNFELTLLFDELRRKAPAAWEEVQDMVNV